jgi:hypothetical protein
MRWDIDRVPLSFRQRALLALHGLFDLWGSLLFGAGSALLAYTLFCIVTGRVQGAPGVGGWALERALFALLVLAFLVGCGTITVVLSWVGLFELLSALRGWAPHHPRLLTRSARAEPGALPDARPSEG